MSAALQGPPPESYLAVGHVVIDVLENGERRPGGTVLYAAVQAARLGLAATIVTRGVAGEIEAALEPWASELELIVQPASETTTLGTAGKGAARRQRVLAWAGPVDVGSLPAAEILHLAPVAAELAGPVPGGWPFVGLTPQGLARSWEQPGAAIEAREAPSGLVSAAGRCDAIVLSEQERSSCAAVVERGLGGGATVAITAGPDDTELLMADGRSRRLPVGAEPEPVDDLGAGDVYASAFFVRLAAGATPVQAAGFAHAAAALRLRGVGPAAIATGAQIAAFPAPPAP